MSPRNRSDCAPWFWVEQSAITKIRTRCEDVDALNRAFAREKESDVELARLAAAVRAFVGEYQKGEVA